jgi:hypothetical protein
MKFVGPPPRGFNARVAIVCLMLLIAFAETWGTWGRTPTVITMALGFVLLAWYTHE